MFGKDKVLRKLLKIQKVPLGHAVYVGDETRDIDAARAVGISVIAVSWGAHSRSLLETREPDYLIDSVSELRLGLAVPPLVHA